MKKLIIILIAAMSFGAVSAQSRDDYRRQDRQTQTNDYNNYSAQRSNSNEYNNYNRDNDRNRREAYDHMNQEYDQRVAECRNDRSLSRRERDRKIREIEQERQASMRSFGNGAIVGGIAGLVVGLLIGHK